MSDRIVPVLSTPAVISIVGVGKTPVAIPDSEIDAIQSIVRSGLAVQPGPRLPAGARVSIVRGPLTGLEGIVTGDTSGATSHLVVSVQLLQRSVAVKIECDWAQPVSGTLATNIIEQLAASAARRISM
jgi:transcription antitermination factor NusG